MYSSFYLTGTEAPCGVSRLSSSLKLQALGPAKSDVWSIRDNGVITATWGSVGKQTLNQAQGHKFHEVTYLKRHPDLNVLIEDPISGNYSNPGHFVWVVDEAKFRERFSYAHKKYYQAVSFGFT